MFKNEEKVVQLYCEQEIYGPIHKDDGFQTLSIILTDCVLDIVNLSAVKEKKLKGNTNNK